MQNNKKTIKEMDAMVTTLLKRWGANGVALMVIYAEPTGNPDRPNEHEVEVLNVAGGSPAFTKHLPELLRKSADDAEKKLRVIENGVVVHKGSASGFPKLLTDLLQKDKPDTN